MKYKKEFKEDCPQTIGETDSHFDLSNYCDWLEDKYDLLKEDEDKNISVNYLEAKIKNVYNIAIKLGLNDEHKLFMKELRGIAAAAFDESSDRVERMLRKQSNKYT